jgi:hypothetical protein
MATRLIHGICMYHGQWLPGDERGWRSRDHKVHSSGDYRHPPPAGEHDGLRTWTERAMRGKPIRLRKCEYPMLGMAFVYKLHALGGRVRCLECGPTHVHVLYDSNGADAKSELAKAKQFASLKLTTRAGRIWARDASVDQVRNVQHARRLWVYILKHAQKEGAWTWRYDRDEIVKPA